MQALTSFRRLGFVFSASLVLVLAAGCDAGFKRVRQTSTPPEEDEAARRLVQEITRRQPAPFGLPDNWTYNYGWAQYMLAFMAAERCGYLDRGETIDRLSGMLDVIETLENHYGFYYDGYDLKTGKRSSDNVYFQGWWFFALAAIRNAYPELHDRCATLLAQVDYEKAGMFDPTTRQLAADYRTKEGKISYWIDLYGAPSGEMRSAYVMYTYLTGDISPWTQRRKPRLVNLEGHRYLGVWHNFVFCPMLVHSVFPDVGYFEHSWNEMLEGLKLYRLKNGMTFFPTRAEPLEAWQEADSTTWPNTEHRIAKPWQAWFADRDAPVMEKAWTPGLGISLYYDNMNFYWSYGGELTACGDSIGGGSYEFPFETVPLPPDLSATSPARLTSVQFYVSCNDQARPMAPLEIALDGKLVAKVEPEALSEDGPQLIVRPLHDAVLSGRTHVLTLSCNDASPDRGYVVYRYEHSFYRSAFIRESSEGTIQRTEVAPPYLEMTIDGQHYGGENPFALLTRCAVVHDYYAWHELADEPQFQENTVAWVGDYYSRASLSRVVHNTSDQPVTVQYERPAAWMDASRIRVVDVSLPAEQAVAASTAQDLIFWRAEPWHTYRLRY